MGSMSEHVAPQKMACRLAVRALGLETGSPDPLGRKKGVLTPKSMASETCLETCAAFLVNPNPSENSSFSAR